MSKDLEVLKANVKEPMLRDWTETEVTKLDEFMENVIIATMVVNKLPIHVVLKTLHCKKCNDNGGLATIDGWEICTNCL